jgi:hypothetical protein
MKCAVGVGVVGVCSPAAGIASGGLRAVLTAAKVVAILCVRGSMSWIVGKTGSPATSAAAPRRRTGVDTTGSTLPALLSCFVGTTCS